MPEYNAGDAKLRIVPDARNFKKELEAKLKEMDVQFTVRLNVELAQAKADMARFRAEEANKEVRQKVNLAGLAQAKADVERFRTEQNGKAINQRVNPQFSRANAEMAAWRTEQRAHGVEMGMKIDAAAARAAVTGLGRDAKSAAGDAKSLGDALSKAGSGLMDIGKAMGIAGLITNIPAAITAVASLSQAIGQLSGAALVVPGAIAAAGASIATLVVGISGVAEAYKAVTAVADESTTGQAERARATASATTSLRNAVVDEALAQKDVAIARRDARQELQDLNLELHGGQISEAQAINDLAKARRDLSKGGFKDQLDYNDALLRVQESEQRVNETHQRNIEVGAKKADADAKGVEGSDLVTAANEKVVRSQQAVSNAQQSLTDAMGTSLAATDKMNDALAKLSPQAAAFVHTLADLRPMWRDFAKTVSGNLFEGASASLTQFVNSVLPNLKSGLGSIASAWNSNMKALLSSLGSDQNKGILDRILGNTAEAQSKFSAAIDPLVRGIGTLAAAGSNALPRLADAMGRVAERFANFIDAADKDGRLAGWIESGLEGFTNLGNIVLNLGKSFFSINDALGGQGILSKFRDLTEKWATFLASTEGQNKLKAFFAEGRAEIDRLKPIVSDLISLLPQIWHGAKDAMDVFMPVFREFADILKANPGLVRDVTSAFVAWETIKGVNDLTTSLKSISTLLRVTIPADAASGAAKASTAMTGLSKILLPLAILAYGPDVQDWINKNIPGASAFNKLPTLDNVLLDISRMAQGEKPTGPLKDSVTTANDQAQAKLDAAKANADAIGAPTRGDLGDLLGAPPPTPVQGPPSVTPSDQSLRSAVDQFIQENGLDPAVALTPDMHDKLKGYLHDKGIPGYGAGGASSAGLAVLHDDEFVLSARAGKYSMGFKHALNEGRIDPSTLPHYYNGGPYPLDAPTDPIAPAPSGPGIPDIFSKVVSGIQGPIQRSGLFGQSPTWAGAPSPGGGPMAQGPLPPGSPLAPGGPLGGAPGPVHAGLPSAVPPPPAPPAGPSPWLPGSSTGKSVYSQWYPGPGGATPPAPPSNDPATDPNAHGASGGAAPGPVVPMSAVPGDPSLAPGAGSNAPPEKDFLHKWLWWLPQDDGTGQNKGIDANAIMAGLPDKLQPQNLAYQFGSIMLSGVLGFFGLDQSILSPSNPWNQDIQKGAKFGFDAFRSQQGGAGASTATTTGNDGAGVGTGGIASQNPGSHVPGRFGDSPPTITPDIARSLGNPTLYPTSGPNAYQVPDWATKLAAQFHLTAATYAGGGTLHDAGYAFDFNATPGDPQGAANMDAFATYVSQNLSGQTLQLIHKDAATGQEWRVAGGHQVGPGTVAPGYYNDDMAGHTDHVHWATDIAPILGDPSSSNSSLANLPGATQNAILYPYAVGVGQGGATAGLAGGVGNIKSAAYQAYLAAGMPPGEWDAFDQLISHESGWNPTNKNPGSTAYGLGQFLDPTWAAVGGTKTADPMQQLQYVFAYLKGRSDYHGSPAAAWSLWQSRSPHWYDQGGILPPGLTLAHNATGLNERILNPAQNAHYEAMLPHFLDGGPFKLAAIPAPPKPIPLPRIPDAHSKIAPPVPPSIPAPQGPPGAPGGPSGPAAPGPQKQEPAPPDGATPPPAPQTPSSGPEPVASAPGDVNASIDHNLPAVSTAIDSAASTLGSLAQTAAAVASMGATAGMGGGLGGAAGGGGGGGGGAGGLSISGLFAQGGKIVKNAVNVASSFLVGNVTPGTNANAYGEINRPAQMVPQTAPLDGNRQYNFNGVDSRNIVDEIRLKDRQDQQAVLARW